VLLYIVNHFGFSGCVITDIDATKFDVWIENLKHLFASSSATSQLPPLAAKPVTKSCVCTYVTATKADILKHVWDTHIRSRRSKQSSLQILKNNLLRNPDLKQALEDLLGEFASSYVLARRLSNQKQREWHLRQQAAGEVALQAAAQSLQVHVDQFEPILELQPRPSPTVRGGPQSPLLHVSPLLQVSQAPLFLDQDQQASELVSDTSPVSPPQRPAELNLNPFLPPWGGGGYSLRLSAELPFLRLSDCNLPFAPYEPLPKLCK